jgi:hypothetical protein
MGRRDRDDKNEDLGFAMGEAMRGKTYEELFPDKHKEVRESYKNAGNHRYTTGSAQFKQWVREARVKLKDAREETDHNYDYLQTRYLLKGTWGGLMQILVPKKKLSLQGLIRLNTLVPEDFLPDDLVDKTIQMLDDSVDGRVPVKAVTANGLVWNKWLENPKFRYRVRQEKGVLIQNRKTKRVANFIAKHK